MVIDTAITSFLWAFGIIGILAILCIIWTGIAGIFSIIRFIGYGLKLIFRRIK